MIGTVGTVLIAIMFIIVICFWLGNCYLLYWSVRRNGQIHERVRGHTLWPNQGGVPAVLYSRRRPSQVSLDPEAGSFDETIGPDSIHILTAPDSQAN